MIEVTINNTIGDFDRQVKLFIKKVKKDGILREVKERRYYLKPSEKIKLKQQKAAKLRREK